MTDNLLLTAVQAAPAPSGGIGQFLWFVPYLLILGIFWMLILRPQQRRARDHQAAIGAVKKGDDVITGGGIRGRVTKIMDDDAEVEIASGVKVRVIKSTLSAVLDRTSKPAND